MIRLAEHQAKRLLPGKGILVPSSRLLSGLPAGPIEVPWKRGTVLKAQVAVASRHKKGLVVFVASPKRLDRDVRRFFGKAGKVCPGCSVLLEERIPHSREYYLSIVSDPVTRGPLLLFSLRGGVDVENVLGVRRGIHALPINILEGLDQATLARFFRDSGIKDRSQQASFARAALGAYELYREWSCRLVELNPLAVTPDGIFALDAKMEIDEDALYKIEDRLGSLGVLRGDVRLSRAESDASRIDAHDHRGSAHFIQTDMEAAKARFGKKIKAFIGFNGVGTGASLTAMDELVRLGFFPRNFCDTSGNPPASKLYRVTRIILRQDRIQGYFFISCVSSQQLHHTARGIIKAFKETYPESGGAPPFPVLLHFRGAWDGEARELFREHGIERKGRVVILGRDASEKDAARAFKELYDNYKKK